MNPNNRRTFLKSSLGAAFAATTSGLLTGKPNSWLPVRLDSEAFLKAIVAGDIETVRRMLAENGKLIDAKDADRKSGYVLAILSENREIAKLLLDSGYETDLHEAALGLDWERFDELTSAEGMDVETLVNLPHPLGGSAMYAAAVGGAGTDIWRVYAKLGSPNSLSDRCLYSPLQAALRYPDLEVAELTSFTLLSNSADPNIKGPGDVSPLHIATERGSRDIVEMLIRLGADVDKVNNKGKTSLDIARTAGNDELIELLKDADQIPKTNSTWCASNTKDSEEYEEPNWAGLDPLKRSEFVGASHGNIDRVRDLLGTDKRFAHSRSTTGERAVEAGAHMGNRRIVEILLEEGAPYSLPTAVMMEDVETTKRYLDKHPDRIHERGAHDFPLLWYPIIGRCGIEMLELLLERGAKVEEQNLIGTTALHFACMRGEVEVVELLIEHGADVKRVGRKFGGQRQTPLDLSRDKKIIDLLKSKGA